MHPLGADGLHGGLVLRLGVRLGSRGRTGDEGWSGGERQGGDDADGAGSRGGADGCWAQGAHDLHSPGGSGPAARPCASSARWGTGTSSHAQADGWVRPLSRGRDHTALTGPMETVAWGARGRTSSPHLEYVTCSVAVVCPFALRESSSTGTWDP